MNTLLFFLFHPDELFRADNGEPVPRMILESRTPASLFGPNGLFHSNDPYAVRRIHTKSHTVTLSGKWKYQFLFFSRPQREKTKKSISDFSGRPETPPILKDAGGVSGLFPFVTAVVDYDRIFFYHYLTEDFHGGLSVRYHHIQAPGGGVGTPDYQTFVNIFQSGEEKRRTVTPNLNHGCWYSKWKKEHELERKYTFTERIPDTWRLITGFYKKILDGGLPRFVPELGKEFQVFDYESHIFEALSPEHEKGYISFIPQTNDLMTVKQKWFQQNQELRREKVVWDNEISMDDLESRASAMVSGGEVKKLPVFRRKRFDVNFESLDTGHIFGVYLDICTIPEPGYADKFGQCEVEYCRSRTFSPMEDVMEEYETVAEYTRRFLAQNNVAFERNLFSKLDFVRGALENKEQTVGNG
jgi:hypothetical protein